MANNRLLASMDFILAGMDFVFPGKGGQKRNNELAVDSVLARVNSVLDRVIFVSAGVIFVCEGVLFVLADKGGQNSQKRNNEHPQRPSLPADPQNDDTKPQSSPNPSITSPTT